MSWITLDQAKARIGIDCADPSQDAQVQGAIDYAISMVESYCQRNFEKTTYVNEYYPYQLTAYLGNWPVESLDQVMLDDDDKTADAEYDLDKQRGIVRFVQGLNNWTGYYSMQLTYTAGYDPIPDDLMTAALDVVMARFHRADDDPSRGPVKFERIDGSVSVSYGDPAGADPALGDISPYIGVLNRYRSETTQGAW